jgi:spore coat polysaccharide biosynthesis predicted glycosyltransferase SpsG
LKIAFRIDIGSETGTGHFVRMSALADVFTDLGYICEFFTEEDEHIDYNGFDLIIVDTYKVSNDYIKNLNAPNRTLVCYDDNALYTYSCDMLVNANLYANELKFKFGAKTPKLLLGGEYALLRREFREAKPIVIKENANTIFVCFGGTDLHNTTPRTIKTLCQIDGVYLNVVLGKYTKNDEEVLLFAEKYGKDRVKVHKTPKSMVEIMQKCDIAVTSSGSMIYEVAALGLPAITIKQADNQNFVTEYMSRNNLIESVGDWNNVDLSNLKQKVAALLSNYKQRLILSKRLTEQVNKNGAVKVVQEIVASRS